MSEFIRLQIETGAGIGEIPEEWNLRLMNYMITTGEIKVSHKEYHSIMVAGDLFEDLADESWYRRGKGYPVEELLVTGHWGEILVLVRLWVEKC